MEEVSADYPSLAGQLLLAMPGIGDPRFDQAVIAICRHRPDGALGIGVGRIVPRLTLHDLLGQIDIAPGEAPNCPIHFGGPVEPQRGFVLHTTDWAGDDTLAAGDVFAFTSTLDVLRAIARGKGPARWLVALGYAGWGIRQLDEEMKRHGWFQARASAALLFDVPAAERWSGAFAGEGIDVRQLAAVSGRA